MGKYDFSSVCKAWMAEDNAENVKIHVESYWQNNGWTYHMQPVFGYTYCNGAEAIVYDRGYPDYTSGTHDQYFMGAHDYYINKNHGTQNARCQARCRSESTYVSGDKWSGIVDIGIGAKWNYPVTYNANGGTGAPGNQTKWHNENLVLSGTRPTRTGYSFTGWSGGYQPGQTYSGNARLDLVAQWKANTYTITYNANGGTGAPGNQTKTYGVNLTLSSTKPTRTNYNFKGWSTSQNGSVVYQPGSKYTNNAAVTLYAVWELAYTAPRISNLRIQKCNRDGTANDSGNNIKFAFDWATDKTVAEIRCEWKKQTDGSWTTSKVTAIGNKGSINVVQGNNTIDPDITYLGRVYVKDSVGSTYSGDVTLGTANYPIDVKNGGKGIAFGKASELNNVTDNNYKLINRKDVENQGIVTNKDVIYNLSGSTIKSFSGTAGKNGYVKICKLKITSQYVNQYIEFNILQRGRYGTVYICFQSVNNVDPKSCTIRHIGNIEAYIQRSNTSEWTLFIRKSEGYDNIELSRLHKGSYMKGVTITYTNEQVDTLPEGCVKSSEYVDLRQKTLYYNESGTSGTVTLSETAANFNYIEIFYNDGTGFGLAYHSTKIHGNNKRAALFSLLSSDDSKMSMRYSTVQALVNNTSITIEHGYAGWFNVEGASWWNAKEIKITKVVGYYRG